MGATSFDGIADFHFVRRLGSGGFATTYLAEREGEQFAVKVLHEPLLDPQAAERFNREVLSLRLSHPNLAEYVDSGVGTLGGRELPYIAMRYVEGRSLREHLAARGGRLPWPDAVAIAGGVAKGLTCLHGHGIVHRDLKPGNTYIPSAGGVVILDFGLASMLDLTAITEHGEILGTPAYCSPEQIRGETDIHTDLYALGVTLFQMLTGSVPFPSTNHLELIARIQTEEPEPPSALDASVPDWLDSLVLMLLAKEPLQRPRNAQATLEALVERRRSTSPVRPAYDRSSDPILVVRTTTKSAARAVTDAAMRDEAPDVAVAAITRQADLEELHRARAASAMRLAVDTRVMDTAVAGYRSIAALEGRRFLPRDPSPTLPPPCVPTGRRTASPAATCEIRSMSGQISSGPRPSRSTQEPTVGSSATRGCSTRPSRHARRSRRRLRCGQLFRAPSRPSPTATTDSRSSTASLAASRTGTGSASPAWRPRAPIRSPRPSSSHSCSRSSGGPCVWTVPGWLAELAWSLGVAGVEVPPGRVSGFQPPPDARQVRRRRPPRRFELPSLLGSFDEPTAVELLASGVLPESDCACPSCHAASTPAEAVARADDHNLWTWSALRAEIGTLAVDARIDRYRSRLDAAARMLAPAGRVAPAVRWRRSDLKLLRDALTIATGDGALRTPLRLRRAS